MLFRISPEEQQWLQKINLSSCYENLGSRDISEMAGNGLILANSKAQPMGCAEGIEAGNDQRVWDSPKGGPADEKAEEWKQRQLRQVFTAKPDTRKFVTGDRGAQHGQDLGYQNTCQVVLLKVDWETVPWLHSRGTLPMFHERQLNSLSCRKLTWTLDLLLTYIHYENSQI